MRSTGILMGVNSLANKYGVGDFGPEAYEFIDIIKDAGFKIWQILPLNPLGYGESPYQPYSSYAMDPIYVSIDMLIEDKLIFKKQEFMVNCSDSIDYELVRKNKNKVFIEAYDNFIHGDYKSLKKEFISFKEKHSEWLIDYALFITLKKFHHLQAWITFEDELKNLIIDDLVIERYENEIEFESFIQFILFRQWHQLKKYANKKNIEIMGDIPFYVGFDSCDVWQNKEVFLLDEFFNPTYVAGVPPDYFSSTGQLWGNPLYDFNYLRDTNYDFWVKRLKINMEVFDIIRIDHFRAFDTFYKIKYGAKDAVSGEWIIGPRHEFFDVIFSELKDLKLVAEDLGDLRKEVLELRDDYNLAGMKIVQFTFDPLADEEHHVDKKNMLVYTGTHDNDTIVSWFNSMSMEFQEAGIKYLRSKGLSGKVHEMFIEYALSNIALRAIIPVQDILGMSEGRINVPSTIGKPNWCFKLKNYKMLKEKMPFMKNAIKKYDR